MNVMIGVDPHKASHTAVAIDEAEDEISSVKVRATRRPVQQLVAIQIGNQIRHQPCHTPRMSGKRKRQSAPKADWKSSQQARLRGARASAAH